MSVGLSLCKKIAKGRSKGLSLKQIARANRSLWIQSELEQALDDFYVSQLHFGH